MSMARVLIAAIALSTTAFAAAAEPEGTTTPSEHRLTAEQIDQVLADAARKREARDQGVQRQVAPPESAPTAVQGEVGVSIGTGGHRSLFGSAVVGLPGDGAAVLSMGAERRPTDPHFDPPH